MRIRSSSAAAVLSILLGMAAPALAGTPTASFDFSPASPYPDEKITLTSTSTPADKLTDWDWDLDNNGAFDDASGPVVVRSFPGTGDHPVGLRVRDTDAAEATAARKIVVIARPKAAFGVAPESPHAGETVTLTATAQDSLTAFAWDLDNDGAFDDATGAVATTSFAAAGTHAVGLQVTDLRGTTDASTRDIVVTPPPVITATPPPVITVTPPPFRVSNQQPAVGESVTFDAGPVDSGHGGVKDHKWDLDGDGTFERDTHKSPEVAVVFGDPGPITTVLQVVFADGTTMTYPGDVVVGPGTPPADCSPYCAVTFPFDPDGGPGCETSVEVGLVLAEADCFTRDGTTYTTGGRVRVNGLDLYPITGGQITIDADAMTLRSTGGIVTLQYAEFTLAYMNPVDWTGLDGEDGEAVMPGIVPGSTTEVEGFGITGRLGVTFHEHRATFDAHIELPDSIGGVDAQLRLSVTSENPATLDELRIVLPAGNLQDALPIDHLILDYGAAENRWLGDVGVTIGGYDIAAAVGFHTIPTADLDALRASLGGLNVSIYAGVFLQEIRIEYGTGPPPDFSGGISLTYGPEWRDRSLVSVEADLHVILSDPVVIRLDGEGQIAGFKVANVQARFATDGTFSFDASVRVGVNPLGPPRPPWWEDSETPPFARLVGEVHGFVDGPSRTFSASGEGDACFGGCFGATMLMSSVGVAGCVTLGVGSVGGGYTWLTQRFDWLAGACDLGRWAVARPGRAFVAQAERSLTLPAGLDVAAFKVVGSDAVPRVTVTGPNGERIRTPSGLDGAKTATTLVTMDPTSNTTYIAVGSPSAGTWKITGDPGSTAIISASSARALPDIHVTAKLGGKGRHRSLRYRLNPIAGQTVVFAERSAAVAHELGTARGATGTLRFVPGEGPAGRRTIVAHVSQGGLPRDDVVVASYRAPKPARPGRPGRVTFKRRGGALKVGWRASTGHPKSYEVLVATINRRQELFRVPARRRTITIGDVAKRDRVRVMITPLTATHQPGRVRRAHG